jgi:CheY-like chemotaxis protein
VKESKGRILIVDDELEMRSLLEDFLKQEGYDAISSPSAVDALSFLASGGKWAADSTNGDIDLIISDIKMH